MFSRFKDVLREYGYRALLITLIAGDIAFIVITGDDYVDWMARHRKPPKDAGGFVKPIGDIEWPAPPKKEKE